MFRSQKYGLFFWGDMMKDKKEIKVGKLCVKYSYSCKRCPRYAKCEEEIRLLNKRQRKNEIKNVQQMWGG